MSQTRLSLFGGTWSSGKKVLPEIIGSLTKTLDTLILSSAGIIEIVSPVEEPLAIGGSSVSTKRIEEQHIKNIVRLRKLLDDEELLLLLME